MTHFDIEMHRIALVDYCFAQLRVQIYQESFDSHRSLANLPIS